MYVDFMLGFVYPKGNSEGVQDVARDPEMLIAMFRAVSCLPTLHAKGMVTSSLESQGRAVAIPIGGMGINYERESRC